jgi:DNA polymerase III delta prime subunit
MPSTTKAKAPKPTQEELDEERLREIEARMKELIQLMSDGVDRPKADERLQTARTTRDTHKGNRKERVFYREKGAGRPIPVSQHTRAHLELAEALKLRIRLGEYALDLGDSLERLAEEHVEVLERSLKRARY